MRFLLSLLSGTRKKTSEHSLGVWNITVDSTSFGCKNQLMNEKYTICAFEHIGWSQAVVRHTSAFTNVYGIEKHDWNIFGEREHSNRKIKKVGGAWWFFIKFHIDCFWLNCFFRSTSLHSLLCLGIEIHVGHIFADLIKVGGGEATRSPWRVKRA